MSSPYLPPRDDRPEEPEPESAASTLIPSYVPTWLLDTPAPESPPVGLRRVDLPPPPGRHAQEPPDVPLPWAAGQPSGPEELTTPWPDLDLPGRGDPPSAPWSRSPAAGRSEPGAPWPEVRSSWSEPRSPWAEPASPWAEPATPWSEAALWAEQLVTPTPTPPPPSRIRSADNTRSDVLAPPLSDDGAGRRMPSGRGTPPSGRTVPAGPAVPPPSRPAPVDDDGPGTTDAGPERSATGRRGGRQGHRGEESAARDRSSPDRPRGWLGSLANRWLLRPLRTRNTPYLVSEVHALSATSSTLVLVPLRGRGSRQACPPGQFVWIRLDGPDGPLQGPPFTIAPGNGDSRSLELVIDNTPEFTAAILALTPGREVFVEGPYGEVADEHLNARSLLLVCAGAGITPVMSLLRAHAHRRDRRPHVLIASGRTPDDLLFADELRHLSKLMNLDIIPIVTQPQPGWTGRVGLVDTGIIASVLTTRPILRSAAVCVCGPASMTDRTRHVLTELGFDERRIHLQQLDGS